MMDWGGFGKNKGPGISTQPGVTPFGHVPRPPSPVPSPRGPEAVERVPSPPLPFQNSSPAVRPYQSSGVQRNREAVERVPSPPLVFQNSSPAVRPYQSAGVQRRPEALQRLQSPPLTFDRTRFAASPPYPSAGVYRPIQSPPRWGDGQRSFIKDYDAQSHPGPSAATSFVASRSSGTSVTDKIAHFQGPKRTRSPPSLSTDVDVSRNSGHIVPRSSHSNFLFGNRGPLVPPRTRSHSSAFENSNSVEDTHPPFSEAHRPLLSFAQNNHFKLPSSNPNLLTRQDQSSVLPHIDSYDSERSSLYEVSDVQAPKRMRSPPVSSANEVFQGNLKFAQNNSKRPSISPPRLGNRSNDSFSNSDSQVPQRSLLSANNVVTAATRPTSSPVPKRTRSPPLLSTEEVFQGDSASSQDGTEREMQAKAKRLARFRVELSDTMPISPAGTADRKVSANRHEQSFVERQKFSGEHSTESARDTPNRNAVSDHEGVETSTVIIGLCPDMCPDSERAERERKGDLDQYERLDGDRNQTRKYLAVKKYNRTAEREANLIRPMPILEKTIDYLLNLLDQPYDDRFLGMYNFLWDRMRAIRMDLRMQHIFNQGAITMLEQMIRLHIVAMHELCEYTKGEGFSEGFDAHLNIEQMNKTSVELFQMYDDHRKKGLNVPTEKEFRGYYALLKLDKHPGYKVEPAELSLDLAKMTPEIRQTPEVLFARDVARACRTGNFIAFFRLARKASYLQACLMHAHFAKLQTQALASLHSGLQNNQGLPVAYAAKWLGMEEEDMESLLEYHGFLIKEFEEPYMVKDGLFLNADKDYPTKCSKLVHQKRSRTIVEDVSPSCQAVTSPTKATEEIQLGTICKQDSKGIPSVEKDSSFRVVDEEIPDSEAVSSLKGAQTQPLIGTSIVDRQSQDASKVADTSLSSWGFSVVHSSPRYPPAEVGSMEKPNNDTHVSVLPEKNMLFGAEAMPSQIVSTTSLQERSSSGKYDYAVENSVPQNMVVNHFEDEELHDIHQVNENENDRVMANHQDEVAEAKIKLIIRLWRRRSTKRRELREQRQLAASAALNSLSFGPPIRLNKAQPSSLGEFDIDHVMKERYEKHERSWSRLNVSDVTVNILSRRNPDAKCLCWKIILCSQMNSVDNLTAGSQAHLEAGSWLLSKLMPSEKDDDLVVSSPGVSLWKKWVASQSGATDLKCCLSVVKNAKFGYLNENVSGASALLFLVSESIPWNLQKIQLNNLLMSIPSGSCLPLLIISGIYSEQVSDPTSFIVNELGLNDIDKSRVGSFLVVFLVDNEQMEHADGFFSDERLREGLKWLASESPLQPVLHCVKARELVLTHLSSLVDVLDKMIDYEVGPNHCISVFNEALDRSLGNIAAATKASPSSWPCPEITLLEGSCDEQLMVKWYLPSIGWSSAARIEPFESALKDCKLPTFRDDISWLARGCHTREEIENQRLRLENCLTRYLTQSSEMMGVTLATKEACVMLQRSTRLELHSSSYYIVPKWVTIFRRVFNWRLMSLSSRTFSSAYVLKCHLVASALGDLDKVGLEGSVYSPYFSSHPSLDEIIEVGCSSLKSTRDQSQPEAFQPLPVTVSYHEVQEVSGNLMEDKRKFSQHVNLAVTDDVARVTNKLNNSTTKTVVPGKVAREADELSKLLEQCNILQNNIAEKLSIYF